MKKPPSRTSRRSPGSFAEASRDAGKQQYLVPYFIAGHPGCDLAAMIDLALFLKRTGYRPEQGAGLHPRPVRRGHVHVPHGHRPDDGRGGLRAPGRPRAAAATGAAAILASRRTTATSARPWRRPAAAT